MFSIPRGYTDGFANWCKQVAATCLTAFLQTTIAGTEQRLSRLMFKVAVELGKISNMLAAVNDIDEETLKQLQAMCVNEVRRINGIISYEDAVEFQKE